MTATRQRPPLPDAPRPRRASVPSRAANALIDHPWPAVIVVAVAVVVLIVVRQPGAPHHLDAVFSDAKDLYTGQAVEVNGVEIGQINSITLRDGQAVVGMGITRQWPLHEGTQALTRWGTTLGEGTRYVQLIPGPASAPPLADNAVIPEQDTVSAVELDQVYNMFDPATKTGLQKLLRSGAADFNGASSEIRTSIAGGRTALDATGGLLADLSEDQGALSDLVTQGNTVTATLAAREPVLADLITVAARTFTEFGTHTTQIRDSLSQFTPALVQARTTLHDTDHSLDLLTGLVTALRPGLQSLHPFLAAARPALDGLRQLAPVAADTLTTLTNVGPTVTRFLTAAQPFSAQLQKTLGGLAPAVACVRPYGPEIASFFTQWGSWGQDYDSVSHYARVKVNQGPTSDTSTPPIKTSTFLSALGGTIQYADPRPPGLNADQPWYQPQCGIGASSTDPADDPDDS